MEGREEIVKQLVVTLPSYLHFRYMQRLHYYDLMSQDVIHILIERFLEGEFDELLELPGD